MEVPIDKSTTLQDLIEYVKRRDYDQVQSVLEKQPNIKTHKNLTALAKAAVEVGSKEIVSILLEHGLIVNAALDIVVNSGKDDLIELMIDRGADVNEGLYFAVKAKKKHVITLLLERGANINIDQRKGNTPLHTAIIKKCDPDLVKHLIKHGANICIQNKNSKTAFDLVRNLLERENETAVRNELEKVKDLVSYDEKVFDCLGGGPRVLSGFSYQIKYLTLYAIINTKLATSSTNRFELSTEVKNLVPFDDIYLRKVQDDQINCEFVQVKQGKIEPFQFFAMLGTDKNIKEYIRGNDSIVKMFIKFDEIKDNPIYKNNSSKFIFCTTSNFQTHPSPCFKRINTVSDKFLCGLKHEEWITDPNYLFVEIKYILLNLFGMSLYFKILDEESKSELNNQIKIQDTFIRNQLLHKNINNDVDETLWPVKKIAIEGLSAIQKYITYLSNCKREIENTTDTENLKKNLPADFEVIFTNDLTLLKNRAVSKINEVSKSFTIDKDCFSYFSKFEDVIIREKIDNFVKYFSIYTDCPTSDELDDIITKQISEEFKFDIPILISAHCLQYFSRWVSNFKNDKGSIITHLDGKNLFHVLRLQIFKAFNKPYLGELRRHNINFRQNNKHVMKFLNIENNNKLLHVITQNTRLHTINIFDNIKNIKKQSNNFDYLNNFLCTSLDHIIKSDSNLNNLLDAFTSNESNDLLILECSDDVEQFQDVCLVFEKLKDIRNTSARKKIIIISKNDNKLAELVKSTLNKYISCSGSVVFNDLTEESQKIALNQTVKFKNNPKTLKTCLNIRDFINTSAVCNVIDEEILSTIVTNIDDIQIGNDLAFISEDYIDELFIPRYLLNIDVNVLKFCYRNLFFVTGISKEDLLSKHFLFDSVIQVWKEDKVYNKGIVLMPHLHNIHVNAHNEIFRRLYSNCQNCYWLEFKGNLLYRKDANPDYYNFENKFASYKLAPENLDDKVVLIANNAGEGKSTMLTHLAHSLRDKSKYCWIIRVDLRNYADITLSVNLNDITFSADDTSKAVELITHMVVNDTGTYSKLERKLFQSVLNEPGKIGLIILFDGFDEISPNFKDRTCNLIKSLAKSNVRQLWVTTRVHLKDYLENQLQVSAHTLASFNDREQVKFLITYFNWHLKNFEYTRELTEERRSLAIVKQLRLICGNYRNTLVNYDKELKTLEKCSLIEINKFIDNKIDLSWMAVELLKQWEKSTKYSDFLKIPLHLEMLAKIVIQREWKCWDFRNSLIFEIYTDFVERKLEIYDNRSTNRKGNQHANDQADMATVLFRKMHQEIAVKTLFEPSTLRGLPVLNLCSEYPNFLEKLTKVGLVKSFGNRIEFVHRTFAEYFFSEYLVTYLKHKDVQSEFIKKILLYEDYYLVRTFIDGFLLQRKLLLLSNQCLEEHMHNFDNILNKSVSEDILWTHNNNHETVLHVVVREGHVQLFLFIFNNISKSNFVKLIMKTSHDRCSILQVSINNGHIDMFNTIVDSINELSVYSKFAIFIQIPMRIIFETLKNNAIQIGITAFAGNNRTAFHQATHINLNVTNIKKHYVFSDLIIKCDKYRQNALHLSAAKGQVSVCEIIINTAKSYSVFGKLIKSVDLDYRSVLHYVALSGNREVSEILMKSLEDDADVCKHVITLCDKNKQTALHLAAMLGRVDVCEILIKSVETYKDIFKNLLTKCDSCERTALHLAASNRHKEICELILKAAEKDKDVLKEIIKKCDTNNNTVLHAATHSVSKDICMLILTYVIGHKNLIKYLITHQDNDGQTALHIATVSRENEICYLILNAAETCTGLLKFVITMRDNNKDNALHMATRSNDHVICRMILNYTVHDEEVFRDVVTERDHQGCTALHLAASRAYSKVCSVILDSANEHPNVLEMLLSQRDGHGHTALELVEQRFRKELTKLRFRNRQWHNLLDAMHLELNNEMGGDSVGRQADLLLHVVKQINDCPIHDFSPKFR